VVLFNWYGYRLLTAYLESKTDDQLASRLDNNSYDETALISIKVPAGHLAYYNSSTQFERFEGQIEIRGFQYNYVKRRLYNDSIEMLCLPNQMAMQLRNDRYEFYKLVNDLPRSGQNRKSGSQALKSFSGEYDAVLDQYVLKIRMDHILENNPGYSEKLLAGLLSTDEHPPQTIA
jgi:hypothetical protein